MQVEELKVRRTAARKERDVFSEMLQEGYDYAIPYRKPVGGTQGAQPGEKRVNRIFDQTATTAVFRGAGRLQQDLCPVGEQWATLEPGPMGKRVPGADKFARQLEIDAEFVFSGFQTGEWDTAFHEMATDLQVSTGALLISEGDDERWMRFLAVPTDELLFEGGTHSDIWGVFWSRKWRNSVILATWPDGKFGQDFLDEAKKHPHEETCVNQDTVYDPKRKRWCLYVWLDGFKEKIIHTNKTLTCPWLTPRYFKVPGETLGRGPVLMAMPAIKTLNKSVELTLKAAAITLLGIYTYTPHSAFNPDTARIEPGAFWAVQSNGGVLGEGIKKFDPPRIDLTQIVFDELRLGVQSTLMDQSLPPDAAAVRSATEIVERVKRLASDHNGAYGRLYMEIVVPALRRAIEIAYNKGLIKYNIPLDQLLVRVSVKSPMQMARNVARVEKVVQFLAMAQAVAPQETMLIIDREALLIDLAMAFGVEQKFIQSEDNRKAIKAQVQQIIAQALAAAQAQEVAATQRPERAPAPAPA